MVPKSIAATSGRTQTLRVSPIEKTLVRRNSLILAGEEEENGKRNRNRRHRDRGYSFWRRAAATAQAREEVDVLV